MSEILARGSKFVALWSALVPWFSKLIMSHGEFFKYVVHTKSVWNYKPDLIPILIILQG